MSTATEPLTAAAQLRAGSGSSSGLWFAILEYTEARYIAIGW